MISFDVTGADLVWIHDVSKRAAALLRSHGVQRDLMDIEMDLTACHANGCPLDLRKMMRADDADVLHDVMGIATHLDRKTGELKDCFLPRLAR